LQILLVSEERVFVRLELRSPPYSGDLRTERRMSAHEPHLRPESLGEAGGQLARLLGVLGAVVGNIRRLLLTMVFLEGSG
jgi:hypothetical protein